MSSGDMNNFDNLLAYEDEDEYIQNEPVTEHKETSVEKQGGHTSLHMSGFREFLLKPELIRATAECGFEHPSEVQYECIPQAILGTDVLCQAKSGMGTTAVFVLSVLQQIEIVDGQVSALVLCHTRELSFQVGREFERFKKFMNKIRIYVVYGGVPIEENINIISNKDTCPHILIGTPGRVFQLVRDKVLKLDKVKHFVLDECDKMLESLDMRSDVQKIFRATPHIKQVMMFSATLSEEIRPLCKKFMHNPLEVFINDGAKLTLHGLQQYYVELSESDKNRKLVDLLDELEFNQLVIFVKTVSRAVELNKILTELNFPSICIHSGLKQQERIQLYSEFKDFKYRILVSTNLFGRGIDIERVNVVINYDMPENCDTYLHRVGRAGRFGTKGLAISFVSSKSDAETLNSVQSRFVVDIKELPEKIDPTTYMTA